MSKYTQYEYGLRPFWAPKRRAFVGQTEARPWGEWTQVNHHSSDFMAMVRWLYTLPAHHRVNEFFFEKQFLHHFCQCLQEIYLAMEAKRQGNAFDLSGFDIELKALLLDVSKLTTPTGFLVESMHNASTELDAQKGKRTLYDDLRALGTGSPIVFINNFDWEAQNTANANYLDTLLSLLSSSLQLMHTHSREADAPRREKAYDYKSKTTQVLEAHLEAIKHFKNSLGAQMHGVFMQYQAHISAWHAGTYPVVANRMSCYSNAPEFLDGKQHQVNGGFFKMRERVRPESIELFS